MRWVLYIGAAWLMTGTAVAFVVSRVIAFAYPRASVVAQLEYLGLDQIDGELLVLDRVGHAEPARP